MTGLKVFLEEELWLFLVIGIFLGLALPQIGAALTPYAIYFLLTVMFLTSLSIDLGEVKRAFDNKNTIMSGLLLAFVVSPCLAFILSLNLPSEMALGVVLVASMPVGMSTAFFVQRMGGNAALTLVFTALTTLLCPFITPIIMETLTGVFVSIDPIRLFISLIEFVILPFILAVLVRNYSKGFVKRILNVSNAVTTLLIFLIVWGIISSTSYGISGLFELIIVEAGLILLAFGVGFFSGRRDRMVLSMTSAYKNATLGMVVALEVFSPAVALPAVIWTLLHNAILTPIMFLKRR
ncbi:MAG: bile acid:sodium symporter [Candidatus Altiarchaeota archaeon]|nr:bile acid:sodium symporter [Candidatus Altiarchaeota archaeon]